MYRGVYPNWNSRYVKLKDLLRSMDKALGG